MKERKIVSKQNQVYLQSTPSQDIENSIIGASILRSDPQVKNTYQFFALLLTLGPPLISEFFVQYATIFFVGFIYFSLFSLYFSLFFLIQQQPIVLNIIIIKNFSLNIDYMFQTDFLSPYDIDESKIVTIKLPEFLINVGTDIGIVILSFLIWKYILWIPIQRLTIPNPSTGMRILLGKGTSIIRVIKIVKGILREMIGKGEILIKDNGFQYFSYLMFMRRLSLIMGILIITDTCIWIPYCLFYEPLSEFSLITMPSAGNNDFRAFYSIWVAFIVLYGLYDLKIYLFTMFMHRTFRTKNRILNNLMTKTLHMQFLDNHFDNTASIKAQMQQYLVQDMQQQDRVLAVQAIPLESDLLQYQYKHEITKIISQYGVDNLHWLWKFFKQESAETIQKQRDENFQIMRKLRQQQINKQHYIRSCMIIVSQIETAQKLCQQFQIGRAVCNFCPDFGYTSGQAMWKVKNSSMIVRWAQNPKDLIWINMGYHKKQLFNFVLFNALCAVLLLISFFFIAITSTDTYIKMPTIIGPAILIVFNSTLRFLICKMIEWEKKTLRSQWQIKQYKMTIIYLLLNVILGSVVRDTLNLLGLLQTGWGWIELFSLIYKKSDGLYYYILILNQAAVSFLVTLVKPGQIFLDCFESGLYYEKLTRVKRKAKYGRNDTFRIGSAYSTVFIIMAVVLIYSVSCPLIHFFGLFFFYTKMYLDTFTISVFHEEQICSNMRLIQKVIQSIAVMVGVWIFLTATSLTFSNNYSNSIILYIFFGLVIYYAAILSKADTFKDYQTDTIINTQNIQDDIDEWRVDYSHPCYVYGKNERRRIYELNPTNIHYNDLRSQRMGKRQ